MVKKTTKKRIAIDKANTAVFVAVSLSVFIVIFSIVAGKALMDQRAYQAKVINQKKTALKQTKKNLQEVEKLNKSYEAFASETTNILGGNPKGNGPKDGENPRIILDAMPSKYDFPALATSVEKMLKDSGYKLDSLSATDDEVKQASNQSSVTPKVVEIPFTVTVSTTGSATKPLFQLFERSIRPMQIKKITITGGGQELKVTIDAKTFYQPEKKFDATQQVVKRSENSKSKSKLNSSSTAKKTQGTTSK